ncbi:hemolysin family protein [Phormidium yuhuli AB48]|uniref:Hemolysin family protein n=1 Tax=Phormidium yuhuli AB48 TaxID=2940671 RepID=A0ABY5AT57_9CYAN|nr:hemolysin family protein [Phormidium yuhuli]USR92414.1 hemolysin family protein [Phormidium yuhuli AB48]
MDAPLAALPLGLEAKTLQDIVFSLLSVLGLIAINAFFVTAEFSMVSVRRSRINQLVDAGDLPARSVQILQQDIDLLLSTTQLGITLSSLALGWIGEKTMASLVALLLTALPLSPPVATVVTHSLSIPLAFLLVAYLQIVLGELCPKSLALLYAEQLAQLLGPPSLAIARFFNPFLCILNQSTRLLLRLVGIRDVDRRFYNRVTPEELQRIIALEGESTGLEAEERELLSNVFEFGDVSAEEVMVPRTQIAALPSDATFSSFLEEVARSGHSRYPIIGESLDDIRGIVHLKELAEPLARGQMSLDTPIQPWVRPARFVPECTLLGELLPLLQRCGQPMVMVVDDFGGTAGLITMQDIIAEIVGESLESEGTEELAVQMVDERTFIVQAQMDLEEVNELLDLKLPVIDEYQTLGGFLIYQMQKIPQIGEGFGFDGLHLEVVATDGPRLHQIQVQRRDNSPPLDTQLSPISLSDTLSSEDLDLDTPLVDEAFPTRNTPDGDLDSLLDEESDSQSLPSSRKQQR